MHILAIVCENGLGHFKRMTGLLTAWCERFPNTTIDLVAEQWQLDLTHDWDKTRLYHQVGNRVYSGITAPGVRWSNMPEQFESGQLLKWEDRLAAVPSLSTADLVLSDNLVGVLHHRPDAVLVGSFLWSEVLQRKFPQQPEIALFAERERQLLKQHNPIMLGVEALLIPEIRVLERSKGFPWFGQEAKRPRRAFRGLQRIGLLAGATEAAQGELIKSLQWLHQQVDVEIALPARLIDALDLKGEPRIIPFGFELNDFEACDLVFCRPGVGTLTDCMVTNTPMVLFYEPGNYEMEYNSQQLEALGVALDIGPGLSKENILQAVQNFQSKETFDQYQDQLVAQSTDGYEKIVNWLESHLSKK